MRNRQEHGIAIIKSGFGINLERQTFLESRIPPQFKDEIDALLVFCELNDIDAVICYNDLEFRNENYEMLRYNIQLSEVDSHYYYINLSLFFKDGELEDETNESLIDKIKIIYNFIHEKHRKVDV